MIVQEGLRRMVAEQEDVFYYLTLMNENYPHPPMPEGAEEGILKGIHRIAGDGSGDVQLLGSGTILREVEEAARLLREDWGVGADVYSVPSFTELARDGMEAERWNMLHPGETARAPYVTQCLKDAPGVLVAASDYVKALPDSIDRWLPRRLTTLGTDGFGRSENRAGLREFFEVDYRYVVVATLAALAREGTIDLSVVQQAIKTHNINPDKANPATS